MSEVLKNDISYMVFHWFCVDLTNIRSFIFFSHVKNGQVIHAFLVQDGISIGLNEFLRLASDENCPTILIPQPGRLKQVQTCTSSH